jgi:CubicO group peptidase (beta-lactamase class C family)
LFDSARRFIREQMTASNAPSFMKRPTVHPILARSLLSIVAMYTLVGCWSGSNSSPADSVATIRQKRIESHLAPLTIGSTTLFSLSLGDLMQVVGVPGLSVAVVDHFEIAWAKGYGVAQVGSAMPVTPQTLFQAGSVSKPVAAAGALSLVESGRLALDEDVNRRLTSWKVPEGPLTVNQKATLRRILTHTAGTSGHGFPGYAVDAALPTLVQVLKGEKPANTAAVVLTSVPGSAWRYSGGGVCIEQLLMTDVTGQPFPEIMRERLFDRIGMNSSTYEQPLPPARAELAASGTYTTGREVPGRWHVYPEMAAGGLWTTPSDLAKFGIEVALSAQGRANHALSQSMAREMLSPQYPRVGEPTWGDKRNPDRMGLGFFLGDASRPARFGHIGDDEGFAAVFIMFGDTGQGAVIMVNSDLGIAIANLVLASIAKEYDWRYTPPLYSKVVTLLYVFLAIPLALVLACTLGLFYALSPAPRAWIAYVLACGMTFYAHTVTALLDSWQEWMVHPLRGPFGGVLLLMPVTMALVVLAPTWRRRRLAASLGCAPIERRS